MARPRTAERDARDFDMTSLHEESHGKAMTRDYTAHHHRWAFARRLITKNDTVLEVGCGSERPLWRMLFNGAFPLAAHYTGVDIGPVKATGHARSTILSDFDFTSQYKKIVQPTAESGQVGFDVAVHMEVIEHMKVEHGVKLLKGCFTLLRPGGIMLMSTPCYDGRRHAANHIHEYTVPELEAYVKKAGFVVERRFGTFMDIKHIGKPGFKVLNEEVTTADIKALAKELGEYYDNNALSCIFAPLYPDLARNNLWVCRKPESAK